MKLLRLGRVVLALTVLVVCVSVGGLFLVFLLSTSGPNVPPRSVLLLRVPGNLVEYVPDGIFGQILSGSRNTVGDLVDTLRKAKVDDRVEGVVVIPAMQQGLWGTTQEIRDAMIDFKESGKPIVAYLEYGGGNQYYLATAADTVYLTPTSPLDLVGVASFDMFFREALDAIGVYPDMLHAGEFKTASNLYTESTFTAEHREMSDSINRDLYEQMVAGIAVGRQMNEAQVRSLIDKGPFLPIDAVAQGLVDELLYEDELFDRLQVTEGEVYPLSYRDYQQLDTQSLGLDLGPKIAVIYAVGTINFGGSGFDVSGSALLGSEAMVQSLRQARDDQSIRAIVIRIDSPGGLAIASDIIWREIELTRQQKPVVVSMSNVAASGGYYIAAPADVIVAQPGTLTGSIGVVGGKFAIGEMLKKIGVNTEEIRNGESAGMNSPFLPYSDEDRVKVQRQMDAIYETFVQRVADGRNMTTNDVDSVAKGRVWTGRQAVERGLVDELGGFRKAVSIAQELAGISQDEGAAIVSYPRPRSFFEMLNSELSIPSLSARFTLTSSERLYLIASLPVRLFQPGAPLALMPGWSSVLLSR